MMNRLARYRMMFLGVAFAAMATGVQAGAPEWIEDAANSKWLLFGGEDGITENNGITMHDKTGEGDIAPGERGGVACARSLRPAGAPGYFYLITEPWNTFTAWLGDHDVLLTLRYYDGAKGTLQIRYDSSDPRIKTEPYLAGVWRAPDSLPDGLKLEGDQTWKTATVRLPFAYFTKRLHGADIRLDPSTAEFALAGVALTRVLKQEIADLLVTQELRVERATGFSAEGRLARFAGTFEQQGAAPILLEAELATRLSLQDGRSIGLDPAASGGAYIHYVESAVWEFTVATPGTYIAWERAFFPWKGGWNHTEGMDGKEQVVLDGTPGPEEGWHWVKGGTYDLTAGKHTFSLSYHGGARLDVVVLSPSMTPPEDLAALPVAFRGPTGGEIWTTPVKPFDVAQWRDVRFAFGSKPEAVTYAYSTNGTDWTPFDPDRGLADIAVAGGGRDSLQFHITVKGTTPVLFAGGSLTYLAGPNNVKVVENDRLRLEMSPYGVKSLFDKRSGKAVSAAAKVHDGLAMVVTKKPGPSATSSADLYNSQLEDVTVGGTVEAPELAMRHRLANGMRLATTVVLRPDGQTEWRLAIDNPTDLEVCEVRFPVLTGVKLGGEPADDWMFVAKCWGQVWQNPAARRLHTYWGPSMRWMAMWDDNQGLYYGIEDDNLDDYAFVFGGDSSGGATLSAHQRILCPPQSAWTSGVYRLALTGPDWHEGADIYRDYVGRTLKRPDPHPYIKWLVDGWGGPNAHLSPQNGWDMMRPEAKIFDSPLMAANRQMTDGADSGYCGLYPYPAQAWGSIREFEQRLALLRAHGGTYIPYHNTHLWSPGYGHYPRIGSFPKSRLPKDVPVPDDVWYAKVATYNYDGSYLRMERDYFAQPGVAMGAREWRDWLAYWTRRYLEWGADGMYYDQFNMIYPNGKLYPDFPDTYGNWTRATLEIISRMQAESRAKNTYYTSSGEVCNDIYGQFLDLHMTSGVFNRLEFYRYCNPDHLLIDGGWNGGLAAHFGGQERYRFIWQVGARFESFPQDRRLVDLRRAVKGLLYDARFMDTVGLTVTAAGKPLGPVYTEVYENQNAPFSGTFGRWFRYTKDGQRGAVVNLINVPVRKDAMATLDVKEIGPITVAWAWTLEGELLPIKGTQQGDLYTFPVPTSECSSVVLANRLPPVVRWELEPTITPGATRALKLTVVNVNAAPMSGTATLRLPEGWKAPSAVDFGPLASGGKLTFELPVTAPADAKPGRHDIWCDIATAEGDFSTYSLVVVNPPVLADLRGNPGSYHLWFRNLSDVPVRGTVELAAPAPLSAAAATTVAIPPAGEFILPVTVEGQARLREISEMTAKVKLDGQPPIELVRAVMPPVPNGDFETDSAGDMKPDWWMCRTKADYWDYGKIHLDTRARSGQYALRLDPPDPGKEFTRAYPVNSALAPSTRYRVSVWIKAEAADGVFLKLGNLRLGNGKTGPEWRQFEAEFTTDAKGQPTVALTKSLYNFSDKPAFFDDLVIEELK